MFITQGSSSEKKIQIIGALILLASVSFAIYSGFLYAFALPLVCLGIFWAILDWKSFYWFFIFMLPFSFEQDIVSGVLSTTLPDEPMMWFFLVLTMIMLCYKKDILPLWFFKHPITFILALQYGWMVVAVIYSQNYLPSIKFLLAKTWYFNAFLIMPLLMFKGKADFIRAFKLFGIPLVIISVFIFIRHAFDGFSFWGSNSVVRPFFKNHVDHSTVLSMALPLYIIAYQLTKGKKYTRIALLLIILFMLPATFVAQARAAMLAIVFSFVVWYCFKKRIVQWLMPLFYAAMISLITFVATDNYYIKLRPEFRHTYTQGTFEDLIKATFAGRDMSSMERLYRWIASAKMSAEHPIVGVGPNNFYDHYKGHAVTMFKTYVSRNPERSTTHNYYLFMLVEQGWPALILYGIFVAVFFVYAQRVYYRVEDDFYKKIVLGLAMCFGAGFVNNFFSELLETDKIGALFFMSVSLVMIIDQLDKEKKRIL